MILEISEKRALPENWIRVLDCGEVGVQVWPRADWVHGFHCQLGRPHRRVLVLRPHADPLLATVNDVTVKQNLGLELDHNLCVIFA